MEKAILRTLAYADIFDYPLTKEEIWKFLISENAKRKTQNEVEAQLKENSYLLSHISYRQGFYSLKGRENIVAFRKKRERYSASKLKLAGKVAGIMRLIPWVKLVGVTGALAMKNSNKDDDIDLLIITSKNRLWLTRGLIVFLVELTGKRRRPGDLLAGRQVKDKICLNMFLDEAHLSIPKKERDLFSAHEVCQMKPIFARGETYSRFLQKNSWVEDFLPNALNQRSKIKYQNDNVKIKQFLILICHFSFYILNFTFFEHLAHRFQLAYMKSRKTSEVTEAGRIRFHPQDAREWVLKEYQGRLQKIGVN